MRLVYNPDEDIKTVSIQKKTFWGWRTVKRTFLTIEQRKRFIDMILHFQKLVVLLFAISCTPMTDCELRGVGYLNIVNETEEILLVEVRDKQYSIGSGETKTIYSIPSGIEKVRGTVLESPVEINIEIRDCEVSTCRLKTTHN